MLTADSVDLWQMPVTLAAMALLDWSILGVYMLVVMAIGFYAGRKQEDEQGYFLGNRAMPAWAVGMSVLATALSAATFIGAPQAAFAGDLSYLILNLGGILGALLVAWLFIPAFYRAGTLTIYGYLGQRFGTPAMIAAAALFLFGRLLASGARLFMAGIAFALILYGDTEPMHLIWAIILFGVVGTAYTLVGGIRAVIWTDTLQIVIVVGAAMVSAYMLWRAIPLTTGEMIALLHTDAGGSKLKLLDFSIHPAAPFTLWTALAMTFFNAAAYGTDQDLAQRMLTCRDAKRGSLSLIGAILGGIPVTLLFMVIGLLLFIFYKHPEVMGDAAPADALIRNREVYPQYLLHHLPAGLTGLAMAGLFAAAMSTLDSTVNAMASSFIADIYRPWRKWMGLPSDRAAAMVHSRLAVGVMGVLLTGFAVLSAVVYDQLTHAAAAAGAADNPANLLLAYALGIMTYAYAGLLGVFLTALLTRRGNTASALGALGAGVLTVLVLNFLPTITGWLLDEPVSIAFAWWMVIGTAVSFAICAAGRPRRAAAEAPIGGSYTHSV